jgi:3-phenylpropionate/trans-cinnamate dioxygenase ferredoxin reductase subunit
MKITGRVLVVGAGGAGSAAAAALSRAGVGLQVVVVGEEPCMPYNRTTVNKGLLSGAVDDDGVALPGMHLPGVIWRTGSRAVRLDPGARQVTLAGGHRLEADSLIIATGARSRSLPLELSGPVRDHVLSLRSAQDSARFRARLKDESGVLIVGAGLIGTETAGVLAADGHLVHLVDATTTPLLRLLGKTVAEWALQAHRAAGVEVRTGTTVTRVLRTGSGALAVRLSDGATVMPAVVLVALGAVPRTDWLLDSGIGLSRDGAVAVDPQQRVPGWPRIYAAGDLAAVPGPDGQPARVEHWGAALSQGTAAARAALADLRLADPKDPGPAELPSYSTYVHGTKLTILGWPQKATGELLLQGAPGDDRFAIALSDQRGCLVAAVGVGGARAVNRIRALLEQQAPVSELALPSLATS